MDKSWSSKGFGGKYNDCAGSVGRERYEIAIVAALLAGACFLTYYFHTSLEIGVVITHIFYIPIVLSAVWWRRKGLIVAVFSLTFLILSHIFLRPDVATINDYCRAFMFLVTGSVVAELSRHIAKDEEALRVANQQLAASEQQLRVSNQQLQADEQQLRTANQQLAASERQLRQQSEFLRNTIDSLGHPFYVIDANDYTVKMANIATIDPNALKDGVTCYELTHRSDRPCGSFNHPCPIEQIKATKKSMIVEHLHYDEDGNERIYEVHGSPIFDSEENISQVIEYCIDVTTRKQAEAERERLVQALGARTKELQSIVYTASHDLQTPLVTVRGFGGQLTKYCEELAAFAKKKTTGKDVQRKIEVLLKEDIPEALKFINAGTDKMRSLLEGLTRLSRIGTAAIDIQPISMNKLMKGVTQAMNYQIQDKGVSVTIGKLPACLGDASQIDQVFSNLLDNALKYLKPRRKGRIDISGRIENDMSIYCVRDNGIGVAGEHQEKIFEIFYRLEPTGPVAGEGLGLTIVRRILDRHNGRIWAESQLGKGSCFFVSLPYAKLQESTTPKRKQK